MQICLAEDNPLVANALAITLHDLGHDVRVASNGQAALDEISKRRPDVVVADYNLPDRHGDEIAAELKRLYPTLAVIVTSGRSPQEAEAKYGPGCGGDAFLPKPFTPKQLLACIDRAVANLQRSPQ